MNASNKDATESGDMSLTIPELLAPAGDMSCLHAAVRAGADAVYLGLEEFNARRNAQNFSLETLSETCNWAHLRGVAIYLTMNTIILEKEFARALDYAHLSYEAGIDALIVQDIGLAAALHEQVPGLRLHASTQMNIHSQAGIKTAAELGCSRVTLARELSLEKIKNLSLCARSYGMEVECFAHGALCICYSGQCLMSSMIGSRSANRGLCAQACRLAYDLYCDKNQAPLETPGPHLLSPKDLSTIDLLDKLAHTGLASLKIEGRMKSPEYVYEVVSVYRQALDELSSSGTITHLDEKKERLAQAFSRGFTQAYLVGKRNNEIMSYSRPNNRGMFIGRVTQTKGQSAEISCKYPLHSGDVIEFWTNKGHFAETVQHAVPAGETALISTHKRTSPGDRVFRVRNAAVAFVDDPLLPRIPVQGEITLHKGQAASLCFHSEEGQCGSAQGPMVEAARTKELTQDEIKEHIGRFGQEPFKLMSLDITCDQGIGMSFSQLHRLRSKALAALKEALCDNWKQSKRALIDAPHVLHETLDAPSNPQKNSSPLTKSTHAQRPDVRKDTEQLQIMAWVTHPSYARMAKRVGADGVYVPVLNYKRGQAQIQGVLQNQPDQAGYPKHCILAFPAIEHDNVDGLGTLVESSAWWEDIKPNKTVFVDSAAGAQTALEKGCTVEIGPHVPLINSRSLTQASKAGVSRAWLSPELSLSQISDLAQKSSVDLGIFISGAQELMICEHCVLMSRGACSENCQTCARRLEKHWLVDKKGFKFPVITDAEGRSHIYNGIELDALPNIVDFMDMNLSAVMIDTTLMDIASAEAVIKRAVRARDTRDTQRIQRREQTTTGHLFRNIH